MKWDRRQFDAFLKSPAEKMAAVLVFGPDEGLVRERVTALVKAAAGSSDDPFRVVEIDGDAVRSDPARLADEAGAISMLGGRRAIRINGVTDGQAKAIEDFLETHRDSRNALVVFEGSDLPGRAALRKLFESVPHAAAIACYHDSAGDLRGVIEAQLSAAGKSAAPAALAYLEQSLGGDRGATRSELEKLILYAGDAPRIELDDVLASIGHSAGIELDDLNYAIAEGDRAAIERQFDLNFTETAPIMILRGLARHFLKLHGAVGRLEAGEPLQNAMAALNSPMLWRDRPRLEKQCRRWSSRAIARALQKIAEAEAQAMRYRDIAESLTRRAGLEIAQLPGRR
ncbi:MAG TPA: DNA polymerase III subunit delta [Candidatus Binatia bacterium]|nr:DNA polymerase III subunit delta [Candidatus Binatia bacterium]